MSCIFTQGVKIHALLKYVACEQLLICGYQAVFLVYIQISVFSPLVAVTGLYNSFGHIYDYS